MDVSDTTLERVVALFAHGDRTRAAADLAAGLGVDDVVVLLRDEEVAAMVPAPGFPQTLRGGPAWRAFAAQAARTGRLVGTVDLPIGAERSALALAADGVVVVLLGETSRAPAGDVEILKRMLPALSETLRAERRAFLAEAKAADAMDAAARARTLADALEAARAESASLNAELREEHRRKDDFLAMLAHELRNPLAPLVTSIGLLRRRAIDAEMTERHLGIMARQVGQLSRLVEDLLDVSRVSRGRIELRRKRTSLGEIVDDAVEINRPLIDARRHRVRVDLPAEPIALDVDAARLTQVFANLIHNAAKYTDVGGHIVVTARAHPGHVIVKVADDGIGMAADVVPRVFDLFAQAPVALDRAQGGLGIGLTLVRALVELHGGQVSAESPGVGRGSTFTVRLNRIDGDEPAAADVTPTRAPSTIRPMRVLVVDDNADAADSIAELLDAMGHHADVAYDGATALARAPDLQLDLVLLDIGLPGMDGYEVARRLRRTSCSQALLVALTGYSGDEDKRKALDAGFDQHVVKPVSGDVLQQVVARAAAREPVSAIRGNAAPTT